ncbi:Gp138 family membrane-puncturing spike protein [Agrobacterium salinitolerans]|uniref:Gp138 family membrane-puncturing spike protein n=1 Tax=Agrobacterium salinitolerans TaxID=1183413 RepID=UPI0022B82D45|nr:Gp138 family membrane-puncturing spike protein [Agrobacterium salinitolerans]MCZ7974352.1 Gp138 family membrane-puncturing spike protein [Agrobacterium salinitolerans]
MPGYIGKTTNTPQDLIGQFAQAEKDATWGPIPGVTTSAWNGRTVNVKPLYKPVVNGELLDMPELFEVPLDQPMTANGGMTFPIPVGTPVMLTPQMRAMDGWEEGGDATPTDARSFHLSNMRASISGGESLSQDIPDIDLQNFHLRANGSGSFGFKASPDGKFQMNGSQGNVFDLLAQVVELLAADTLLIKYGSSAGSGHQLQYKDQYLALAAKLRAMVL